MESKAKELKALQILFIALLAGQVVLGLVACFVVNQGFSNASLRSITYILLILAAFMSIGALATGYILFHKRLDRLRELTDLSMKMQDYRAACILKWALFEGPCLFAIICYFLTGQSAFLGIALLLLLNFLNNYPSKRKLLLELDLSSQEEELFD
jgi:4-hydroxybenzoate polyprenyltransferase